MTIAARIHTIRKSVPDLSARELSELAEVSNAYVTILEAGDRLAPSQAIVARLAKVLGTTSDYLGSGIGTAPKPDAALAAVVKARKRRDQRRDPKSAA